MVHGGAVGSINSTLISLYDLVKLNIIAGAAKCFSAAFQQVCKLTASEYTYPEPAICKSKTFLFDFWIQLLVEQASSE